MITVEENTTLIGFSELRTKMKEVLEALKRSKVVLALRNKPLAVLVPFERYRQMEAVLDRVEDQVLGHMAKERERLPVAEFLSLDDVERKIKRK